MIDIPKGLYEVLVSDNISDEVRFKAIRNWSADIVNLETGEVTPGAIAEEDAELIIEAYKKGNVVFEPPKE